MVFAPLGGPLGSHLLAEIGDLGGPLLKSISVSPSALLRKGWGTEGTVGGLRLLLSVGYSVRLLPLVLALLHT